MERRASFDSAAQRYNAARPSYPDEVIDWIIEQAGIETDELILEIAPGTGQATVKFLERGYSVHCVELGANMARLLTEKCAGYPMTVDVSPFESWAPTKPVHPRMIVCATAFHWLDPAVRYQKCFDLLPPGGVLALLWNQAPSNDHPAITRAYDILFGAAQTNYVPPDHQSIVERQKVDIAKSGLFTLDGFQDYKWLFTTSKEIYIEGFFSQSSYLSLPKDVKQRVKEQITDVLGDLEDPVGSVFHTETYIARKKEG